MQSAYVACAQLGVLHFYYCCFPSQFYHIIYTYLGLHFLKCPVFLRIWRVFWSYTLMSQISVVLPVLLDLNSQFKFICNLHNLKFVLDFCLSGIGITLIFLLTGIIQKGCTSRVDREEWDKSKEFSRNRVSWKVNILVFI